MTTANLSTMCLRMNRKELESFEDKDNFSLSKFCLGSVFIVLAGMNRVFYGNTVMLDRSFGFGSPNPNLVYAIIG